MAIILGRKGGGSGGGGGAPSGPAGGSLTGTYPNPGIANLAVDTGQIADDAVDADKIDGADAADIRTLLSVAEASGWVADSATWTYASASTFTVSGDRTAEFTKGTRLRFTQTTVKYGVVASSSHAAGTTTVTIIVNTDYVLANAAISATSYSYAANPQGYPGTFNWAHAAAGFSSFTTQQAIFSVVGNVCTINMYIAGVSNNAATTASLPVAATDEVYVPMFKSDNSGATTPTIPGRAIITNASTTITFGTDNAGAAWTGSGNKSLNVSTSYRF